MYFSLGLIMKDFKANSGDVDSRMLPFCESAKDYQAYSDMTDVVDERYENGVTTVATFNGEDVVAWDNKLLSLSDEEIDKLPKKIVKFNNLYKTKDEFAIEWLGLVKDSDNTYGYYSNPYTQYSEYEVGGMLGRELLVKNDTKNCLFFLRCIQSEKEFTPEGYKWVDIAKIKDIEWELMKDIKRKKLKRDYGETNIEDIENSTKFSTHAVLDIENNWINNYDYLGNWRNDYFENFIKTVDEDMFLAVISCRI